MNRSRSNFTVRPSSSGLNLSSIPANASSSATIRGQVGLEDRYSALAAANSGMWIAADFSPPDISECFFLVSRCRGGAGGERLKFEGVPGPVVEHRGEDFPVGLAPITRAMVMDHRPELRAQLGQPIGT